MKRFLIRLVLFSERTGTYAADPQALAITIDRRIAAAWNDRGIQAAPKSDDAEFFRRVFLDTVRLIPAPRDVSDFLAD